MRYYIYISNAKVDMLLPQISKPFQKKITREFGVDWKILSAKQTTELAPQEHRTHRLRAVEDYLREHEEIGTVDNPKSWLADELDMKWGPLRHFIRGRRGQETNQDSADTVWFAGAKEAAGIGLGGSSAHMIGDLQTPGRVGIASSLPGINQELIQMMSEQTSREKGKEADEEFALPDVPPEQVLELAWDLALRSLLPEQRVEFLARRLLSGDTGGVTITIGTPLYVALAD